MGIPGETPQKKEKKGKRQSAFMRALSRILNISAGETRKTREELAKALTEGKDIERIYKDKLKVKEADKGKEKLPPIRERIRKASVDAAVRLLRIDPRQKIDAVKFKEEMARQNIDRSTEGVPQGAFRKALAEKARKTEAEIRQVERAEMVKAIIVRESGNEKVDFGIRANIEGRNIVVNLDQKKGDDELDIIENEEKEYIDKNPDIENNDKEERKSRVNKEIDLLREIRKLRKEIKSPDSREVEAIIEKVEDFLKESKEAGQETVLLEEMIDTFDLDEITRKQVHISVISKVEGLQRNASSKEYEKIQRQTERKPLHTQLLELSADKLVAKHNQACSFYIDDYEDTSAEGSSKAGEEIIPEEKRREKDTKLRGIVNTAIDSYNQTLLEENNTGRKFEPADLYEKNTILQIPGGVAIVTSDAGQFARLVNMGEDHEAIAKNLEEQPVAGAYLKGRLANSIKEKGYEGDVIIIYAKEAEDEDGGTKGIENKWYERDLKDSETSKLIYHEIEHLLQQRNLEAIEDLHSGSDAVLEEYFENSNQARHKNLFAIYKDIITNRKNSKYFKQAPDDPIFKILAEGNITKEAGIHQLVSLYYGSKGIEFDALTSVERRGRIFEEAPGWKGGKIDAGRVFELAALPDNQRKIMTQEGETSIEVDPWENIAKENPLLQAVYFREITSDKAKIIYSDFDSPEKLMMIKDEIDSLMKTNKLTSISQLIHKISAGEVTLSENSELNKLELIKMLKVKGNDLKFVKRASEILGSFFKDTETRDALFEYSAILTGGKMAFGEGLMNPEDQHNQPLIALYKSVLGEKSNGPGDLSLRRLYLQTPEGEIPEEHIKLFKFMIAVDMILQRSGNLSTEELDANRRHIASMIYTDYNKGTDYLLQRLTDLTELTGSLSKEELKKIEEGLQSIIQNKSKADPGFLKKILYGDETKYLIPYNPDVDFSVFPTERYIKDILGAGHPAAAIDIVDALQRVYAMPFAMKRHRDIQAQVEELREARAPDYLIKAVQMRSPYNRGGEESSIDSNWYQKIVETLPLIGGLVTPGNVEWAKSSLFTEGHPLYGRSMKRVPIIGPILDRHFPVVLKTGLGGEFDVAKRDFTKKWGHDVKGLAFPSDQLITGDKNVMGIMNGIQAGLQGLGMDDLERIAFLKAMPMFRTIQMGAANPPQIIPSQAELEEEGVQIWADRTGSGAVHKWKTHFENEIVWGSHWDGTKVTIDDEIAKAESKLANMKGLGKLGTKALSIMDKIKGLDGAQKEATKMKEIYNLMAAQPPGGYSMRHLVEMARKAHEGGFWDPDPGKPRKYYFKVGIPDPNNPDGEPILFDLKDVNTFVQRYNRAYAKEIFASGKDPKTGEDLEAASPDIQSLRVQLETAEMNRDRNQAQLKNPAISDNDRKKLEDEIGILDFHIENFKKEIEEKSHTYKFLKGFGEGYDEKMFFDIVWGEVDGMKENMEKGAQYYADYQFRIAQIAMMERRTFHASNFFNKLDRILNNIGHWSLVAGLAITVATGAPVGITILLGGSALILANTAFVNKYSQLWLGRRIRAIETREKLDSMLQMYEEVQSGKLLSPATLSMLERQKATIEFMTENIMRVTAKDSVKLPADRLFFAVGGGLWKAFDEMGVNMLAGKI